MPEDSHVGRGTVIVSLVAWVGMALGNHALASLPPAEATAREGDLPARVAAVAERIRLSDPTLQIPLKQGSKIAQWRNF